MGQTEAKEFKDGGLNANSTETESSSFEVKAYTNVAMFVIGLTGAHKNHVVTVQVSPDNKNWFDSTKMVQGIGFVDYENYPARFIRAKVTKVEGRTSTINITFYAKGE